MTIASPPHQLTAEDLLGMQDNNSMEFVNGQIVEKPVSDLSCRNGASNRSFIQHFY